MTMSDVPMPVPVPPVPVPTPVDPPPRQAARTRRRATVCRDRRVKEIGFGSYPEFHLKTGGAPAASTIF
jgi:hypothetical protein